MIGVIIAFVTWITFRDIYNYISPKLFWTCNLFPHFLVWSGSSSKEQLVILSGMVVINFAAKRSFAAKNLNINLIFVLLAMLVIFIIRPNYFVIYFVILTTALLSPLLQKMVSRRLSVGIWVLVFSLLTAGVITYLWLLGTFFSEDLVDFMRKVQYMFLAYSDSGSNRINIQWGGRIRFLV